MKKTTQLILFFLLALTFHNCEKAELSFNGSNSDLDLNDQIFQSENFGNTTTGNFMGTVTDKSGMNLEGVQITIGNIVTTTDRNGIFVMNNVDVFENFAYIKAQKTGYMNGSRVVIPKVDGVNNIRITLLKKEVRRTVNSGEASEVLLHGAKVSFNGDFITSDGNPYVGQVDVVMHYLNPNRINTFEEMPGSLFAQTASNSSRALETYGMLSVSLFSPGGQSLNIDENNPAIIEFPVDYTQSSIAPDTITLWYFDEEVGYWKEEGEAIKQGNKYVGEVTHFSWWNCDVPFDSVNFCFSLLPTGNDAPTPYRVVIQRNTNDQVIFSGIVLSGQQPECGLIPKNEEVKISVYGVAGTCFGQLTHEEIVGGYATDTSVNISFANQQISVTNITGTVTNCNGNPLTNGYVFIDYTNTFSITDGMINIGVQHCLDDVVNIQVFDSDTDQWTVVENITLNGTPLNLGTLSTCDNTGGIFNGDITLSSQEDVNNFGLFGYKTINGQLTIGGDYNDPSNITNLSPLSALENVEDRFNIRNNDILQNLDGLNNLTSVSSIRMSNNNSLVSISSLSNLTNAGFIYLGYNTELTSLSGLEGIIGTSLTLFGNNSLTSLVGLESIATFYNLKIENNENLSSISQISNSTITNSLTVSGSPLLTSLEGVSQISTLNLLEIGNNDALVNLSELSNLTSVDYLYIGGNDSLENLDGLENLLFTIGVFIGWDFQGDLIASSPNTSLADFCALENLFVNGTYIDTPTNPFNGVNINYNAFNPSVQDIINGNCN